MEGAGIFLAGRSSVQVPQRGQGSSLCHDFGSWGRTYMMVEWFGCSSICISRFVATEVMFTDIVIHWLKSDNSLLFFHVGQGRKSAQHQCFDALMNYHN